MFQRTNHRGLLGHSVISFFSAKNDFFFFILLSKTLQNCASTREDHHLMTRYRYTGLLKLLFLLFP